jgi:hypothetical protein
MATLVIQESTHYHDAHALTLVTQVVYSITVIGNCYHTHAADGIGNISNIRIWPADGDHDHVADGQIGPLVHSHHLVVAECYHAHAADTFGLPIKLWTYVLKPPKLPVLKASGQGETFLTGLENGSKLPGIALSIRAGLRMGEGMLPDLGLAAEGQADTLGSLGKRLPGLFLSARGGIRGGKMKLPVPTLSVTVTGDLVGRLGKTLPGLSISATGSSDTLGTLTRRLPAFTLQVTVSATGTGTLDKKLPTVRLTGAASMITGEPWTLSCSQRMAR